MSEAAETEKATRKPIKSKKKSGIRKTVMALFVAAALVCAGLLGYLSYKTWLTPKSQQAGSSGNDNPSETPPPYVPPDNYTPPPPPYEPKNITNVHVWDDNSFFDFSGWYSGAYTPPYKDYNYASYKARLKENYPEGQKIWYLYWMTDTVQNKYYFCGLKALVFDSKNESSVPVSGLYGHYSFKFLYISDKILTLSKSAITIERKDMAEPPHEITINGLTDNLNINKTAQFYFNSGDYIIRQKPDNKPQYILLAYCENWPSLIQELKPGSFSYYNSWKEDTLSISATTTGIVYFFQIYYPAWIDKGTMGSHYVVEIGEK